MIRALCISGALFSYQADAKPIKHHKPITHNVFTVSKTDLNKVQYVISHADAIDDIKSMPLNKKERALCGALAAYRESQGESFFIKRVEASIPLYSSGNHNLTPCEELALSGRYPWVKYSISWITPKNKKAWEESQRATLEVIEKPYPVEFVANTNVFKGSKRTSIYLKTKRLVFYNINNRS